jgi:hypothetical protein
MTSASLTPLMTALDHLDNTSDVQQLAQRVKQVCLDQGQPLTDTQALDAAQQALIPAVADQQAAMMDYLRQRPATQADWQQQILRARQAVVRKRWWGGAFLTGMGSFSASLLVTSFHSSSLSEHAALFAFFVGAISGALFLTTMLYFLCGELTLKQQKALEELQTCEPSSGPLFSGDRHWSESTQALRAYRQLKSSEVPLLNQDISFLMDVAHQEWDTADHQTIHQRLAQV